MSLNSYIFLFDFLWLTIILVSLQDVQSFPLMKTTHECEQSIEVGGVLKSTVCTETHVYRPFANGMSGGSTIVIQKLTYNTYRRSTSSRTGNHNESSLHDDFKNISI